MLRPYEKITEFSVDDLMFAVAEYLHSDIDINNDFIDIPSDKYQSIEARIFVPLKEEAKESDEGRLLLLGFTQQFVGQYIKPRDRLSFYQLMIEQLCQLQLTKENREQFLIYFEELALRLRFSDTFVFNDDLISLLTIFNNRRKEIPSEGKDSGLFSFAVCNYNLILAVGDATLPLASRKALLQEAVLQLPKFITENISTKDATLIRSDLMQVCKVSRMLFKHLSLLYIETNLRHQIYRILSPEYNHLVMMREFYKVHKEVKKAGTFKERKILCSVMNIINALISGKVSLDTDLQKLSKVFPKGAAFQEALAEIDIKLENIVRSQLYKREFMQIGITYFQTFLDDKRSHVSEQDNSTTAVPNKKRKLEESHEDVDNLALTLNS